MPRRIGASRWIVGLSLVAFACSGGGGGGSPTAPEPPPDNGNLVVVSLTDFAFDPKQIDIAPGTTVRWVMHGQDTTHTTTALDGTWDSGKIFKNDGDSFEHTFTAADNGKTFEYRCASHYLCCMMQGSVRVGSSAPPPGPGY